jgi:microcystin-dependent protein
MARNYSSTAGVKTLASDISSSSATQLTLTEATDDLPSPPFMLVINPDTAKEEIVLVQLDQSEVSEPTYKIVRGQDETTPTTHTAGDTVKHMIVGSDLQLPHDHIDETAAHGATGAVVGTTNTQTLTNKTVNLTSNTLTGTKAQFNTAMSDDNFATLTGTETLTNKTLTSPVLNSPTFDSGSLSPVGSVTMFAGSSAPTGWLLCDGTAKSRTTYAALWDVLRNGTSSSPYGNGDGSTTFNLPDLLGRVPMGAGTGTGLTARTLGAEVGSESTTLTSSHIPEHVHTINHGHADTISANQAGHDHTIGWQSDGTNDHDHALNSGSVTRVAGPSDGGASGTGTIDTGSTDPAITISGGVTNHTGNSGNYGTASPTAVTAVQPSTVVNFIIKF